MIHDLGVSLALDDNIVDNDADTEFTRQQFGGNDASNADMSKGLFTIYGWTISIKKKRKVGSFNLSEEKAPRSRYCGAAHGLST